MGRPQFADGDLGSAIRAKLNQIIANAVITINYAFDLSANLAPTSGSLEGGGVARNDEYQISVGGNLDGSYIDSGMTIRAKEDNPGDDITKWRTY